jgi:hypothetical protein
MENSQTFGVRSMRKISPDQYTQDLASQAVLSFNNFLSKG